jgi:hypothetical protein
MGAGHWRPGGLLGSPFNVNWRFSVPAEGVEGSKLCLFSVIRPAKCVSGISTRFHYRRVAFCFLPLAAILEFSMGCFLIGPLELFAQDDFELRFSNLCLLSI